MSHSNRPLQKRSHRLAIPRLLSAWSILCLTIFFGKGFAHAQGYQYSQTITLSHAQVPNTDQTNFPVLISGTYPYLATVANGGQVQNSNGYDIIFTSDAAGQNQLDHEIDSYNPLSGAVNFWVRIPTLSHTTDTVIYLFYGNPSITTSQENKAGVWQNNYTGVWHFSNALDSLGANNGTVNSGVSFQSGQIGQAAVFAGNSSSYITFPNVMSLSTSSTLTESVWVNAASVPVYSREDAELGSTSNYGQFVFSFQLNGSGFSAGPAQGGVADQLITGAPSITAGSWHYLTLVLNSGNFAFYQDGVQIGSQAYNSTTSAASTNNDGWILGEVMYQGTSYYPMEGAIDNATVSSVVRSSDWIATEYANESAPWNFYTVGGVTSPLITSISPASGGPGVQVTIQGSNFGSSQGSSSVTFNGVPAASIVSWSSTQIVAVTPSTVTTGPVLVIENPTSSNDNVVYTAYNPIISSLSPPAGEAGAIIVINGSGFGSTEGRSYVAFNGTLTNAQSWSNTSIQAWVPGIPNGPAPVTVTVQGVTSSSVTFTVEGPPTVTSISPTSGTGGTLVTINGSGFGSTQSDSTVAFNGLPAVVNTWTDSQIVAVVPATGTGPVSVTVAGVTGNGPTFTLTTVAVLTNSQGNQTTYTSTMIGGTWVLLSEQGPGCSTCSVRNNQVNTYDSNGNLLTTTDANGNTLTYTYDSYNNVLSQTAQLNGSPVTTSYTYNSFGEPLTVTDPLGNTTTNAYDGHGNLTSVTSPAPNGQTSGSVIEFAYNSLGELTQITDPLGNSTTLTYYPTGLIQTITDAQNNTTSYAYDARGNRTSVIDPVNGSAHPTSFSYDVMNRLLGITYPNGTSVSFTYDYRGRRITATDQNNHTTTYAYDDADRLLSITDPANNITQLGYDTESNLASITDANNHTTSFTYDIYGRVIQTTFPSSLIETYGYDPIGNLTSKTDRKNQTIQYVYDALYRLTNKIYPDSTSANYIYDLVGKIRQVTDPSGTYGFAYDNMGRLIGTTTQYSFLPGVNIQNGYTYDAASNRISMTAPDGSTNAYSYDTLNRLNTLTSSLTGQFNFSYDGLSRRTQLARPNGTNTNYSYDSVSNLLSVLHQAGSTTLDGSSYGYDNAGNATSNTNHLSSTTSNYGYDTLYQLLSASGTGESYTYDSVGNRLSSANVSSCSYNPSNQLISSSLGSYTYDANGNTLTDPTGKNYTWDFENRLTQVVVPGTGTVMFKYDPFARRISKNSPTFNGVFAYDGYNLIETMTSNGAVLADYTMTQAIDEPLAMRRSGNSSYYEADGLGSITSLTSATGSPANTYSYDSFGNITNSTGSLRNSFFFAAREYDNETSLYFNRFRYYNPSTGSFLSEDPNRFWGGVNFYGYVYNDPTRLIDPLGLCGNTGANHSTADRFRCAAANASSFAKLVGISQTNFLGQSFLGNDVSTLTNLFLGPGRGEAGGQLVVSNPTKVNLAYRLASGVGSTESTTLKVVQTATQDAFGNPNFFVRALSVSETAAFQGLSKAFAAFSIAKGAYDVGAFAYAYAQCGPK
jgi:RHS repeat-associated protein